MRGRETERQRDRETERQRDTRDRETHRQTDRQTDRQANRQTYRQTDRQAGKQTDRRTQTNRKPDKHTDSQANKQTQQQTHRHTDTHHTCRLNHSGSITVWTDWSLLYRISARALSTIGCQHLTSKRPRWHAVGFRTLMVILLLARTHKGNPKPRAHSAWRKCPPKRSNAHITGLQNIFMPW